MKLIHDLIAVEFDQDSLQSVVQIQQQQSVNHQLLGLDANFHLSIYSTYFKLIFGFIKSYMYSLPHLEMCQVH